MFTGKVGFVGFGEVNSPKEIISRKCLEAMMLLEHEGLKLVSTGYVSDDAAGIDVARAILELSAEDFDVLILCLAGWIPSHAVIAVISEFRHKPMILWGLAGYMENGRLVTTADQAGTTALRKVMEDMGCNFIYVYNTVHGPSKTGRILQFVKAAQAVALLRCSRIGMMGYRDMNLYGTTFDAISLKSKIGVEVEIFEMLEIARKIELLDSEEVRRVVDGIKDAWEFEKTPKDSTLETGAAYYLAIREKIRERNYGGVSLIDVDGMKKLAGFPPAMIFMLLSDNLDVCTIPENDALGAVAQLIVKYLTGQIAAYFEFYEFMEDRLLVGVPDFVPSQVVDGKVRVCPAGFGSFSEGILNVSKVKTGKITLCRLIGEGSRYKLHVVTGEAMTPGPWEEAGWAQPAPQLPGLEIVPDIAVEEFAEKVASQHYILSYGDNSEILRDFCKILNIEVI